MKNLLAPLALLTLAPLSNLRAEEVTYSGGVGGAALASLTKIHLPAFDRSLGELNRVDVEFWSDLSAQVALENHNKMRKLVHIDVDAVTTLRSGERELLVSARDKGEADLLLRPFDGQLDLAGESSFNLDVGISFHRTASVTSGFGAFMGVSGKEITLLAGMRCGMEISGDGVLSRTNAWADYRVRITYTYNTRPGRHPGAQKLDPAVEVTPGDAIKAEKALEVTKA